MQIRFFKFDDADKNAIQQEFVKLFLLGWNNQPLADQFFGGVVYRAENFVKSLRRRGVIPKGFRPEAPLPGQPEPEITEITGGFEVTYPVAHVTHKTLENRNDVENFGQIPSTDPTDDEIQPEVLKQSLRERDQMAARMNTERNRTEQIKSMIRQELIPLSPVKIPRFYGTGGNKERILSGIISDIHTGQLILDEDSSGIEIYDVPTFHHRVDNLIQTYHLRMEEMRHNYNVNVFEINFLGDNVEGETIYPSQGLHISCPTIDQLRECRDGLARVIAWASTEFAIVRIRCVNGNHGRPGIKGVNHPRTNWDDVLYEFLRMMFVKQQNVEFVIAKTPELVYTIPEAPEFNILLTHGQNAYKSKHKYLRGQYAEYHGFPIDYIFLGHWHGFNMEDLPHGAVLVNGAWMGGNSYTRDILRSGNAPKQILVVFNPEIGIDTIYHIFLENRYQQKLSRDTRGVYTPTY